MNFRSRPFPFWAFFLPLLFAPLRTVRAEPAAADEPTVFPFEMRRMPAGYWVACDPVTQAEYEAVTGENPSRFQELPEHERHPVENVSWEDATEFCIRLTAAERAAGRLPAGWRYDLPTDAQFDEFSASADLRSAVMSLDAARPQDATAPVGPDSGRPPSPLGLRDVFGNVWQWCRDWYDESIRRKDANPDLPPGALIELPGAPAPAGSNVSAAGVRTDPALDPPDERFKVLRGGAWNTTAADGFRPASRLRYAPGMSNATTGFRCVLVRD